MKNLPTLPTGDSSFENIRLNGDLYVDKTRKISQMVRDGKYYFLSRPRRFGKSLMVSTLKCLFEGREELFEGLWIKNQENNDNKEENVKWEWKRHPVIALDFNQISHQTPEILVQGLSSALNSIGGEFGIELKETLLKEQFKELIKALNKKTKMPVVILIDEYDKPLIDHLGKGEEVLKIAKKNRDILKDFFGVIKGVEVTPITRFVFITGVSKFSQVSIFSELNNLTDLTMLPLYSDMLGYTMEEVDLYFTPYVAQMANRTDNSENEPAKVMDALINHYNGYRFSERDVKVFNPYSFMSALKHMLIEHYWFETGTPSFLINLIKEQKWYPPAIENIQATKSLFSVYDLDRLQLEALLFQTGYITIKNIRGMLYTFDYPNQEVKTAFLENLFFSYTENYREGSQFALLCEYLELQEFDNFIETMKAIYASIPNILESNRDEAYFHTIFYLMVSASGVRANSEVLTCKGRIDLVVEFNDKIYIIEFKCNQSSDTAINQIREKKYADSYQQRGKDIHLIGINFDTGERNISDWKHELSLTNELLKTL
ncbi:AAA-ATPase [Desulfamplus magnetovallimortis]|uniref:AAA-ATPase n=1 Tax=Desulfamplus magnetovallimortis TaxID=1246637 RepID=A0A1W1HIN3_9BACT|nr:ATP-binding protein [Desulfamplus magnetovallimortis]SLM32377.1 AAA-ATPase [Desulfamplus magnetovallimortis]